MWLRYIQWLKLGTLTDLGFVPIKREWICELQEHLR